MTEGDCDAANEHMTKAVKMNKKKQPGTPETAGSALKYPYAQDDKLPGLKGLKPASLKGLKPGLKGSAASATASFLQQSEAIYLREWEADLGKKAENIDCSVYQKGKGYLCVPQDMSSGMNCLKAQFTKEIQDQCKKSGKSPTALTCIFIKKKKLGFGDNLKGGASGLCDMEGIKQKEW